MNIIKILLNREFIIMKKLLNFYLILFFVFPLLMYLFFSIPLSYAFYDMKPIYMIWSSCGIWIVSSLFLTYLLHFMYLTNSCNSEYIKSLPIQSYHYLFCGYIYAIIIGLVELFISMIITISINSDYIGILDLFKIIFIVFPSMIIICNISFLVFRFIYNSIAISISHIFIFLFISFACGSFIPLYNFPEQYSNIVQYLPIANTIVNVQRIISSEPIYFSMFFSSIFYVIIFTVINYFMIENYISNK